MTTTQIELTITTEVHAGDTYQVIDQSGELVGGGEWTADAVTADRGSIEIQASIAGEADLDALIAQLQSLRDAARTVERIANSKTR